MSFGILSTPKVLHLDRFLRHVLYVNLVDIEANVILGVIFSFPRENTSLMCHKYCRTMHKYSSWRPMDMSKVGLVCERILFVCLVLFWLWHWGVQLGCCFCQVGSYM